MKRRALTGVHWQIYSRVVLHRPCCRGNRGDLQLHGALERLLGPYLSGQPRPAHPSLALYAFQGEHSVDLQLLMAAATVVMLPLLALFAAAQRYFIQGVVISESRAERNREDPLPSCYVQHPV